MYKYILAVLCCISKAYACDLCSCSPAVMNMDVLSLQPQSTVGVSTQYRNVKYLTSDVNMKRTQVLSQSYFISYAPKKWVDIRLSLPLIWMFNDYHLQDQNTPDLHEKKMGLGDLMLFSNFRVYAAQRSGKRKAGHALYLGYGMSFPTGSKRASSNQLLQDFNFGTQSVAYYCSGMYSLSIKNWGLVNAALVKLNMYNKDRIRYGHLYTYQLSANYTHYFTKGCTITPMLGVRSDIAQKNLKNAIRQPLSGSWMVSANIGIQVGYRGFIVMANLFQPVAQNTSEKTILQKTGVSATLRYEIKRKNKLTTINH